MPPQAGHIRPSEMSLHYSDSLTNQDLPTRTATFEEEPGFYSPSGLWFYGNIRLLHFKLAVIQEALDPQMHTPTELSFIEQEAERLVLEDNVRVTGAHNAAHQRMAIVPLRWGAPRIVVFSWGFRYHLGKDLDQEPFRAARLWRYAWDPWPPLLPRPD